MPTPTITTPTQTGITATTAILGANVTDDGGGTISERGIVYSLFSKNPNPTTGPVTQVPATGTTGVFTVNITGLIPSTAYVWAAYATNEQGTVYTTVGGLATNAPVTSAIRLEYASQNATHRSGKITFPSQIAGASPQQFMCTLRNISVDPITVTRIGGTNTNGSRYEGWFIRDDRVPTQPTITLQPNQTVQVPIRLFGRSVGNVLEYGSFTGSLRVDWLVPGSSTTNVNNVYLSAAVDSNESSPLPDLRITKSDLFTKHYAIACPMGGQTRTQENPFGLHPTIISSGYLTYFQNEVAPFVDWVGDGIRPVIFIDRMFGNDLQSNNAGDLPFDSEIDYRERGNASVIETIDAGFAYLGTLNLDVIYYIGSLQNDADFIALATAGNWVGLYDRMEKSVRSALRLPNLKYFVFDDPFLLSASDPRNRIYECLREICEARGVPVLCEPRGVESRVTHLPENNWGCCSNFAYFQRSDPAWGNGTNGWSSFSTQISTSRLDNVPVIQWHAETFTINLAEHIAGTITDSYMRSRSVPYIFTAWGRNYRVTLGKSSDDLLQEVNVILAQITGEV